MVDRGWRGCAARRPVAGHHQQVRAQRGPARRWSPWVVEVRRPSHWTTRPTRCRRSRRSSGPSPSPARCRPPGADTDGRQHAARSSARWSSARPGSEPRPPRRRAAAPVVPSPRRAVRRGRRGRRGTDGHWLATTPPPSGSERNCDSDDSDGTRATHHPLQTANNNNNNNNKRICIAPKTRNFRNTMDESSTTTVQFVMLHAI